MQKEKKIVYIQVVVRGNAIYTKGCSDRKKTTQWMIITITKKICQAFCLKRI
ncbi:hypothetical protein ShirakiTB12_53010 [Priestia megaterium]|uniref:Uncharacterized protein n=1 Tax=Priestia megaterium TaxID=1404 RepID=A0AAX6BSU6_PRIMG|nr:hypothetical protein ShirakiTB12_53010 [Priestia megaterium]